MSDNLSVLSKARQSYQPKLPAALRAGALKVVLSKGKATESVRDQAKIKALFPNTYGAPYISMKKSAKAAAAKCASIVER